MLQQSSPFRPFMRELVALASVALRASYHDVICIIRAAAIKRDGMIRVIFLAELLMAIVALSFLALVLLFNLNSSYPALGFTLAGSVIARCDSASFGMLFLILFAALKEFRPMSFAALFNAFPVPFGMTFAESCGIRTVYFGMSLFVFVAAFALADSTATAQTGFLGFIRGEVFKCSVKLVAAFSAAFQWYTLFRHGAYLAVSQAPAVLRKQRGDLSFLSSFILPQVA